MPRTASNKEVEFSARADRIRKGQLASDAGVSLMRTIEGDAAPIHKLITSPRSGNAHRVMVVEHPGAAFGDSARSVVEPHSDAFGRDVPRFNLKSPKKRGAEVHS